MSFRLFSPGNEKRSSNKRRSFKLPSFNSRSSSKYTATVSSPPCPEYRVDNYAETFGTCKCGRPQSAHYLKPATKVEPVLKSTSSETEKRHSRRTLSFKMETNEHLSPNRSKSKSFNGNESPMSYISSPGAPTHEAVTDSEIDHSSTPEVVASQKLDSFDQTYEFEKPLSVETDSEPAVLCHEFIVSAHALAEEATYQDWIRVLENDPLVWNNRWGIVHNNCMYLFKSFDDEKPADVIILDHLKVFDDSEQGRYANTFSITTRAGRTLVFQANTPGLKRKWMNLLITRGYENQMMLQRNLRRRHTRQMKQNTPKNTSSFFTFLFVLFQVWFYIWLEAVYFVVSRGKIRSLKR